MSYFVSGYIDSNYFVDAYDFISIESVTSSMTVSAVVIKTITAQPTATTQLTVDATLQVGMVAPPTMYSMQSGRSIYSSFYISAGPLK
jgi:hypothetical protein